MARGEFCSGRLSASECDESQAAAHSQAVRYYMIVRLGQTASDLNGQVELRSRRKKLFSIFPVLRQRDTNARYLFAAPSTHRSHGERASLIFAHQCTNPRLRHCYIPYFAKI